MSSLERLREAQITELESSNMLNQKQAQSEVWKVVATLISAAAAFMAAGAALFALGQHFHAQMGRDLAIGFAVLLGASIFAAGMLVAGAAAWVVLR